MKTTSEQYENECREINSGIFPIKEGESVTERLKVTDKLVVGYNQHDPIPRALGFKSIHEMNIHPISCHVFNKSDLVNGVRWLLANGYDIVYKPKTKQ
jgi:hypothetical protein